MNTERVESLRIAYFAGTMRPGHDGVTRVLYHLVNALNEQGIENIFFSPIIPDECDQPTPMYDVPSAAFPFYKDYRIAFPSVRHFEDRLRTFRPHLIHINSPCSLGFAAARYGQRNGIPVVATYHTHFPSYAKYYKVRPLESMMWGYLRMLYGMCDRIYVPSQSILNEVLNHRIYNLRFLPHGVETSVFHPRYRSRGWRDRIGVHGKNVLLFVGRLVWEKDLRTLAETYQILDSKRSDTAFVIVGDGPVREELKRLMPHATFLGQLSGVDLSMAYASSDQFIFPSTTETFGNVVVEAMASGLVPICAREGGAYGSIDHGTTGLLTNPRDPVDLAEKVEFLINQPGKKSMMADQALRYARRQTWERIFEDLFADYADVVRDSRLIKTHRRPQAA